MYIVLILMNPFTSFWPGLVITENRILAFTRYCKLQQRPGLGEISKANTLTVLATWIQIWNDVRGRTAYVYIHVHVNAHGRTAEHNTTTKYEQCISLELRFLAENISKKRKIRLIRLCNIVKHFQYLFYLSSLPHFIRYILYILHIKYDECRPIHVHARLNR